jgi:hypothetical protein
MMASLAFQMFLPAEQRQGGRSCRGPARVEDLVVRHAVAGGMN